MSMEQTYEQLKKKYEELLYTDIPEIKERMPSFQKIAGYPNFENVVSNYYKFFLEEKYHGFGNLFLTALNNCVGEKFDINLSDYTVEREYRTKGNGRIDLVIYENEEEQGAGQKVVIIENKIYHTLENNLEDYWDTFSGYQITGIVLTIGEQTVPEKYINVTHKQWISEVRKLMGDRITNANPKYLILLQDFIEHMINYYEKNYNMDSLSFLYDHGNKIQELTRLKREGISLLQLQIEQAFEQYDRFNWKSRKNGGLLTCKTPKLDIYIHFPNIFYSHLFSFEVWFYCEISNSKNYAQLKQELNSETLFGSAQVSSSLKPEEIKNGWNKLGEIKYEVNKEDLIDFGSFLLKKYKKDLEPVLNMLEMGTNNNEA